MTRLLINEVATFLGKRRSWVYQNLYRFGQRVDVFVTESDLAKLVKQSFLSSSYERYPYELLADEKLVKKLRAGAMLADFYKHAKNEEELYELVFAARVVSVMSAFNLLSYIFRKTKFKAVRGDFKKYAFDKLVRLCCGVSGKCDLSPLLGGRVVPVVKAIALEPLRLELLSLV